MPQPVLTLPGLKEYASEFLRALAELQIEELYGVTDGKAVGTFVEQTFHTHLEKRFTHSPGNAASGIDFPDLQVDLKVTSIKQPQSSCPFRSASQKVYGLGYHLLVFVYDKHDDAVARAAHLRFQHAVFVRRDRTADHQTTHGLLEILRRDGNLEDVAAFLEERNLPLDEIGRTQLAERILREPPTRGVLTMSNALQWRLQYGRTIAVAGDEDGVERII
jgi:restriction system protein